MKHLPIVNNARPAFAALATTLLVPTQYRFLLVKGSLTVL